MLYLLFACGQIKVPSCEEATDTACFRGGFKTLLGAPIEGVEICAPEYSELDCVTTNEDGGWKLPGLPVDTNVYLTANHPDYVPSVFPQHTSMSWYDWYKVGIPPNIMETNANQLDVSLSPDHGHLLFLVWEGLNIDGVDTDNVEGVTAVTSSGEPPFYANAIGLASSSTTETTSSGSGGLLNVEMGQTEIQLSAPAGPCAEEHMFHYQRDEAGWLTVPILSGYTTAIDVICPVE